MAVANASSSARVCLLDISDWPGGQLTASAVPAVDFGAIGNTTNARRENIVAAFAAYLWGPTMPGDVNLGNCWVSRKCFTPAAAVRDLVEPLLARLPNLVVSLSTAVLSVDVDAASGRATGLRAVRRTPAGGRGAWDANTSAVLADWYTPADSAFFTKEVLDFAVAPGGVLIEATEFGDVLAASGLGFAQGIESPLEDSDAYIGFCGQGTTIPFFLSWHDAPVPTPDPWPPGSLAGGPPFAQQGLSWERDWTYRRVDAPRGSDPNAGACGETSVINVGGCNDYSSGYLFLAAGSPELQAQLAPGAWRGGVNLTAYALAEQRAFGCYHFLRANASAAAAPFLALNASLAGTATGLAKMPYLRDTRRARAGLGGFRLYERNLTAAGGEGGLAFRWPDTVAIGVYFYADIHKMEAAVCPYPSYIAAGSPVAPYYIPFRALTVEGAPNLLVAGKTMAQTFFANAATRLHPEEWASGAAAGVAAALMVDKGWASTQAALDNIAIVQAALAASGAPLEWTR